MAELLLNPEQPGSIGLCFYFGDNVIRVLIAADFLLERAGLRALLKGVPGIEVVGDADNGGEMLNLTRKIRPDVLVMDLCMPSMDALESASRIIKRFPKVRVVVVCPYVDGEHVWCCRRLGAAGYLLKDAHPSHLEDAIRAVSRGLTYFGPGLSEAAINGSGNNGHNGHNGPIPRAPVHALTPRQRQVLRMMAQGERPKEIAKKLEVSVKTVEMHRAHVMARLEISNLAGLVRYAIREGLIQP